MKCNTTTHRHSLLQFFYGLFAALVLLVNTSPGVYAQPGSWSILTPVDAGRATVGGYFPMEDAFDAQPAWDAGTQVPVGGTGGKEAPYYADRYGYIDLGPGYADLRITQVWTQYRPWSGGDHDPYAEVWWDDDSDHINDNGIITTAINFNSAQGLSNISSTQWVLDKDHSASPVIPPLRYLIFKSPASMTARAYEYAFVGYVENSTSPPAGSTFTYLLDLGNPSTPTAGNWNNITANQDTGTRLDNLVNTYGGSSSISFVVLNEADNGYGHGEGYNTNGYTGEALGYPATACSDSYFSHGAGGTYQLAGLQSTMTYSIKLFGVRMASTGGRVGSYTINGVTQTLDAQNNTTDFIVFTNLLAAEDGTITLDFGVAAGSTFGYINVLELSESGTPSLPLPTALSATSTSPGQVMLSWEDNSSNETGYEISRSETPGGPYSLVATTVADVTTYEDLGLSASTGYYYVIRAVTSTSSSAYSAEVSITTAAANEGQVADHLEIAALRDLYEGTNGANWMNKAGWPSTATGWDAINSLDQVVSWYGITKQNGDITGIALVNNNLNGNFPGGLTNLRALRTLNLSSNHIAGIIPGQAGLLENIELIDLSYNDLTGSIPLSLSELVSLKQLFLPGNNLSGNLDDIDFSNLVNLESIYLNANQLHGPIPSSFEHVPLKRLFLSANQMSGPIPHFLFQKTSLIHLLLTGNQFTGTLPNTFNLPQIQYIDIGDNLLSGEVPPSITTLGTIKRLTLSSNNFEGAFPTFDLGTHVYDMNIDNNRFTSIPLFSRVDELRVEGNQLTFESLEAQFTGGGPRVFSYSPQNQPTEIKKYSLPPSNGIIHNDRPGGAQTNFQWERWDGTAWVDITGATQEDLALPQVNTSFIGNQYRCRMTNSLVTGLTIYSSQFKITQLLDPIPENYQVTPLYNGNITSMHWRTTAPVETDEADFTGVYLFDYDDKYQLTEALWGEVSPGEVTVNSNQYRVTGLKYDANGNIERLKRYTQSGEFRHNFKYHPKPGTNQLARVERLDTESDYANYDYNAIGQLEEELREDGRDKYIEYDVTGKVVAVYDELTTDPDTGEEMFVESSKKVSYTYDDRGFRLTSKNYEAGITTWYIRDASGNVVSIYEEKEENPGNLSQKEVPVYGSGKIGAYYPDQDGSMAYELTDHLGNVRAVVSRRRVRFEATMEDSGIADFTNPRVEEMQYFQNLATTELRNAGQFLNNTVGGDITSYLTGEGSRVIGPAITLAVKPGMELQAKVRSKYEEQGTYASPASVAVLADLLGTTYTGLNGQEVASTLSDFFEGALIGFANTGANDNQPLAFLNVIYFDEQFNVLDAQKVQVGGGFATGQESAVDFAKLTQDIIIGFPGYLYVYVSNHTPGTKVYFDDLSVELTEDIVTQATDYYPFGSVARRVNTPNSYFESPTDTAKRNFGQYYRWGFQGQFAEEDPETNWNSFELRMFDPVIGRWLVPDPYNEFWSPYLAMGNNPLNVIDPDGGVTGKQNCPECNAAEAKYGALSEQYAVKAKPIGLGNLIALWNDIELVAEGELKIDAGIRAKMRGNLGVVKTETDINVVNVNVLTMSYNLSKKDGDFEFLGGDKGLRVSNSIEANVSIPINFKGSDKELGVGFYAEQQQRVHHGRSKNFTQQAGLNVLVPIFSKDSKRSINSGRTPTLGSKFGKEKDFYGLDLSAGAQFLLGIDAQVKVGFKH